MIPSPVACSDKNHAPVLRNSTGLKITASGKPIVTDRHYDFATFEIDEIDMYGKSMANVWMVP